MTVPKRVRILACGSLDGGDDAVALLAAAGLPDAVRSAVEPVGQLGAEHLTDDQPDTVRIVVDCVAGLEPGEIVELPLAELPAREAELQVASTHALPIGQAVALAASLGALRAEDRFLGVGGASFGQGDPLSPVVQAALPELRRRLAAAASAAAAG
ncbi:MAG TPA: hydrogenase maturation protease [Candidatus Limnocylindria bacterium]